MPFPERRSNRSRKLNPGLKPPVKEITTAVMINRLLIRIKVLQVLYAYYLRSNLTTDTALDLLEEELEASYRLYLTLCGLPIALREIADERLLREMEKFVRSEDAIRVLNGILSNPVFDKYAEEGTAFRTQYAEDLFVSSDLKEYHESVLDALLADPETKDLDWSDAEAVKTWWRTKYGIYYLQNLAFEERLQDLTPFLNDDILVIFTFVTKLVNAMDGTKGMDEIVKPRYSDDEVRTFSRQLLSTAIEKGAEYRDLIAEHFKNWDKNRVSEIDYIIMQMAIAEAVQFPLTPTTVIINEYLNLSHYYSAPNSHVYINGILHEILTKLKEDGSVLGV